MPRKTKRPARRNRKQRKSKRTGLGRSVPRRSLQFKNYTYQFKLLPQLITVNNDPAASLIAWKVANPGGAGALAGIQPLSQSELGYFSPSNGFTNCCDLGLATAFQLTDIVNYTAYTTLYDAYKINKVTMTIEYLNNVINAGLQSFMPTIWMYYDQDDQGLPTTASLLTGKQGVKKHTFGSDRKNTVSFSFTPTVQQTVAASSGNANAMVAAKPMFINSAYPSIPHQALKLWIADCPARLSADGLVESAFRINWTYDVSFRSPIKTN